MSAPFIVAELGACPGGGLEGALATVRAAAEAGASACKIQLWTPGTMCLLDDYPVKWKGENIMLTDLYRQAETPWAWVRPIFDCAKECGIVAFASPFDKQAVDFLEANDCPIYKIASFEFVDRPLIEYVAKKGKPMILSAGMATSSEIMHTVNFTRRIMKEAYPMDLGLTILKCTSAYPADASDANLATLADMRSWRLSFDVGLSDHTPGIGVAVAAAALGASVIEKHFCLSRADGGLDSEFSLEPQEFAQMVVECRRAAAAIGEVRYGPSPGESTSLRRSLYFARDMEEGEVVTDADVVTARPALGMMPGKWADQTSRKLLFKVKRGDPVLFPLFQ